LIGLKTAEVMNRSQFDVTLITSKAPLDYHLPSGFPDDLPVVTVIDPFRPLPARSMILSKMPKHVFELWRLIRNSHFDVVHYSGGMNTAYLLGLLKATGISCKAVMTLTSFEPSLPGFLSIKLLNKIDMILTLSKYTKQRLIASGIAADQIHVTLPGVGSKWETENHSGVDLEFERFVLFWRDAEWQNGADICAEAFARLATEYHPNTGFIFAIRPAHEYEERFRELDLEHDNIKLYVFPYDGFDIADLVAAASLVVLPFKRLSINPQLALLETLATGTPVITTPIESNEEVVISGETGILVAPTVDEVCDAVRNALDNPLYVQEMGVRAKKYIRANWNWKGYEDELTKLYEGLFEHS
ncbi:MAG: glycosyltransferase family 4 protein, partial [Dehalococcoidia bacterium]|nr:glycosyltransferase family 4 protein [Dehalococcoidia bacterium]